jgi:triphosphatase
MSAGQLEIEWQFDVDRLDRVESWLKETTEHPSFTLVREGVKNLVDTYYDTPDWRILRAGYALRVRQVGAHAEATLKALVPTGKGARQRQEISESLSRPGSNKMTPLARLLLATGAVGGRVRAVSGAQPLRVLFSLRTMRMVYALHRDEARAAEVVLDETVIPTATDRRELLRVEVELDSAPVEVVEPFVKAMRKACALHPTTLTKYETGLEAQKLGREARLALRPDVGSQKIKPTMTLGDLALVALRKRAAMLVLLEPRARMGDDIEAVHKMRVATRSIRAALRLFADALPQPILALTDELKWLGGLLGAVRDTDVLIERINAWKVTGDPKAREWLLALLNDQRTTAQRSLLDGFNSSRYAQLIDALARSLRAPPALPVMAKLKALDIVPSLMKKQYRKLRQLGDVLTPDSLPADYHQLRIVEKRLRYGLEFVDALYGKPARRMVLRAAALQELLGQMQDVHVAIVWLRGLNASAELHAQYVKLVRLWEKQAAQLLAQFPRIYKALRRGNKKYRLAD